METTTDLNLQANDAAKLRPRLIEKCPRCNSIDTKFCYYNNYSLNQPRHYCKTCRRYWTHGGICRNIPIGGSSYRRNKRANVTRTRATSRPNVPRCKRSVNSKSFTVNHSTEFGHTMSVQSFDNNNVVNGVAPEFGTFQKNVDHAWDEESLSLTRGRENESNKFFWNGMSGTNGPTPLISYDIDVISDMWFQGDLHAHIPSSPLPPPPPSA